MHRTLWFLLLGVSALVPARVHGQPGPAAPLAGSVVEDRAAAKLLEAGTARYEAEEATKAVEIWQSVIERYPKSKVRFAAHMRLGNYFLERDRSYDRARVHFEVAASEANRDEAQRAEALAKTGTCFYHARNYGKCFVVMRELIEKFPVSAQVNQAYYYIGLSHFQSGHYSRAIEALEKVGTALSGQDSAVEKLEAGKRFFIRIEDADLAVLEPGQALQVRCQVSSGDVETVACYPVGRGVRLVLGSTPTRLGKPVPGNGQLEVKGDDTVKVTYIDQHTAEKELDRPVLRNVAVVGTAVARIMDGAFGETLRGVVLDKEAYVQIGDADADISDAAESIKAVAEIYRPKTDEEIEAERKAAGADAAGAEAAAKIERFRRIDRVEMKLVEARVAPPPSEAAEEAAPAAKPEEKPAPDDAEPTVAPKPEKKPAPGAAEAPKPAPEKPDDSVHSGLFRGTVALAKAEKAIEGDDVLQALPGDFLRITYLDEKHRGDGVRQVVCQARCLEGNIGGVRVTRAEISDEELRIQTQLKIANALTNIANRYKEFGLKENAKTKYQQALAVCDDVVRDARGLGGRVLEQTYVQLWTIYFEMEEFSLAAAMCQRLQREFPSSGFVDDAMLQLARVAAKQGEFQRAISIYARLVGVSTSQLRGEAQFGVAECYEQMAAAAQGNAASHLHDRAFQEYKKLFEQFPQSGRVGEAVAKMAAYYYQQKDYARAIDTFETVLGSYPDAKFMDVILFNYGRCLFRLDRKAEARRRFDQLIAEFPNSPLAADAKKISDAMGEVPP